MKDKLLATALVGKTHGLLGYLKLNSLSGENDHLVNLKKCVLKSKNEELGAYFITDVKLQANNLLVKFQGYDTPEKAKLLSGTVMYVNREDAAKLEEGEYYVADLIGLDISYNDEAIATVEAISEGSQALYLNVRYNNKLYYIPNMHPFVSKPDFKENKINLLMRELLS